ncbi:MAG: hypothetical protein CMO98_06355 [Woeseia sp.]|nr:hypothetical protein [Woeseia sp.]
MSLTIVGATLLPLTTLGASTTLPERFSGAQCGENVDTWIRPYGIHGEGFSVPAAQRNETLFKYPTSTIGRWLLLEFGESSAKVSLVSPETILVAQWDDKCVLSEASELPPFTTKDGSFTDQHLSALLETAGTGVIYTWSPHMNFSVKGIPEIFEVCSSLEVTCQVLLDPNADSKLAKMVGEKEGISADILRQPASVELLFRDLYNHSPSLLLFQDGKLRGPVVPGYRSKETQMNTIRSRLNLN